MNDSLTVKSSGYYQGNRIEMLKFVPVHSQRILEIGCGEGNFGALLKEQLNAEVWGIDYEPDRAKVAGNRLDKILCGDVAMLTTQLPDNYFDAIICNDVLEHLIDPYSVLEGLKNKLSRDGVIVSSIPNIRYFRNLFDFVFRKNWDYTKEGIMDFTHFRFFTVNSIRKMYETLNFEIIKMEGIHPTKSLKPLLLNLFTFGSFSDIKFLQFVTVAKLKK